MGYVVVFDGSARADRPTPRVGPGVAPEGESLHSLLVDSPPSFPIRIKRR